jgi:hypothetical protein
LKETSSMFINDMRRNDRILVITVVLSEQWTF